VSSVARGSAPAEYRLEDLGGLVAFLDSHLPHKPRSAGEPSDEFEVDQELTDHGRIFCTVCQRRMRMRVTVLHPPDLDYRQEMIKIEDRTKIPGPVIAVASVRQIAPSLFRYVCVECEARYTAIAYRGPSGAALMVLPEHHGGVATPNTPAALRYYLDQGERAQAIAAFSAAVPMYRSALEHMLFDAGYRKGNLVDKIEALERDRNSNAGPDWARHLDEPFMTVLRKLGNAALHTNEGDISKQAELDEEVLSGVQELFAALLDRVYEVPARHQAQLAALQQRVTRISTPPTQSAAPSGTP
jgi:hypothetical protein